MGLKLSNDLTYCLYGHSEELVNHQLGRLDQAIAPQGLQGNLYERSLSQRACEWAERVSGKGFKPAMACNHSWPMFS